MNIQLSKLTIVNFKGIKNLSIDFTDETVISGRNESGKTTILDSFLWCLFGKDHEDRKDHEIKNTVDKSLNKSDHVVTCVFFIDGFKKSFSRVYKEKWQKKRGDVSETFTGNETEYFIDLVKVSQKDYNEAVNSILPVASFKLLTNPLYFNSIDWKQQRELLTQLIGDVSDYSIAGDDKKLIDLLNDVTAKRTTLETVKKSLAAQRSELNKQLETLPVRIDEVIRQRPEPVNVIEIQSQISAIQTNIAKLDEQLADSDKAFEEVQRTISNKRSRIHDLYTAIETEKSLIHAENTKRNESYLRQLKELQAEKQKAGILKSRISDLLYSIERKQSEIDTKNRNILNFREDFQRISIETMPENSIICPTCKQSLPVADQKAIAESFEAKKADRQKEIVNRANLLKSEIVLLENEIKTLQAEKILFDTQLASLATTEIELIQPVPIPLTSEKIDLFQAEIQKIESETAGFQRPDNAAILAEKKEYENVILSLRSELNKQTDYEKSIAREKELTDEKAATSQAIADIERQLFTVQDFENKKITFIETKVNSMFKFVKFRMFNQLINGGTEPTCETLVSGVPYSSANNAGKINAGIDIINTFSKFYGIFAPIWVDNAESVNSIEKTESQIIKLYVTNEPLKIN